MKLMRAGYSIMNPDLDDPNTPRRIYRLIEEVGRVCYKSENQITDESGEKFIRRLIASGHEAILEHSSMTVKFVVDRGVSHEIVRHRLASFAQESTRYCNYMQDKFGREISVIEPVFFMDIPEERRETIRDYMDDVLRYMNLTKNTAHELAYGSWYLSCKHDETEYFNQLQYGLTPQEARDVLPTSLKTEIVMTANFREWRHFLKLRAAGTTGKPHPQMLEVAVPLLNELRMKLPVLFEDILPMEVDVQ